jgi:hypothetical protein
MCAFFSSSENLASNSYGDSMQGSVGVPSTVLEPPNVYRSRWNSIRVMYMTMFLSSVSFTLCAASIWPYLLQVCKTTSSTLCKIIGVRNHHCNTLFGQRK